MHQRGSHSHRRVCETKKQREEGAGLAQGDEDTTDGVREFAVEEEEGGAGES